MKQQDASIRQLSQAQNIQNDDVFKKSETSAGKIFFFFSSIVKITLSLGIDLMDNLFVISRKSIHA